MIELDKASPGDRFGARDGEVWTYVRRAANSRLGHMLSDRCGIVYGFCADGSFWRSDDEGPHDLIRALDDPAPAEAELGDAEWARTVDPIAKQLELAANFNGDYKNNGKGAAALAKLFRTMAGKLDFAVREMRAAPTDEALILRATKAEAALEEARKVIAPFADFGAYLESESEGVDDSDEMNLYLGDYIFFSFKAGDFRAARDWHSKHGGGE